MKAGWLLIYDGECPLCIGLSDLYVRLGWIERPQRVALQDLEGDALSDVMAAGFGNEMAVYQPEERRIVVGMRGIFQMLSESWVAPAVWVLDRPVLRQVCDFLYRFIGSNRRFLSLPRPRGIQCACDPDPAPWMNGLLIVGALLTALFAMERFDLAAARAFGLVDARLAALPWRGALVALVGVLSLGLPREVRLRALAHASMALVHGALILLLAAVLSRFASEALAEWILGVGAVSALLWLAVQVRRRARYLGLVPLRLPAVVATVLLFATLLAATILSTGS